ncbi:MAG: carboxymuconolactone decarboxylase family protein [Alphaproteobacteria bacterium]
MTKDRMPPIAAEKLNAEQKKAAEAFKASRGIAPFGPFVPLLRSPEVMTRAAALGEYLRYRNSLPKKLSELAILVTSRVWGQEFEWHHHRAFALEAGLEPETIEALAEGRRPEHLAEEAAAVYDFLSELHANRSVSDGTYAKALARFGEQGIIDLIGIAGYYGLLAMAMNVARTPLPEGTAPALPKMPH